MSFSVPGVPPVDIALEPANIRRGGPAAQKAYEVGLGFERMLVNQLAQQLTATAGGSGDGLGGGSDASSGPMGSDAASSTYAQMLPEALSSGVMSAGGLGIAAQIAAGIDPALLSPKARS